MTTRNGVGGFARLGATLVLSASVLGLVAAPAAAQTTPPAESGYGYGYGHGGGIFGGYWFTRAAGVSRPVGFEVGYWRGISDKVDLVGSYGVSHRSTNLPGGGLYGGGDNRLSVLGGANVTLVKAGRTSFSVGLLAGLDHTLGLNAGAVVPQATVTASMGRRANVYVRGGMRAVFASGGTTRGGEVAVGFSRVFGR